MQALDATPPSVERDSGLFRFEPFASAGEEIANLVAVVIGSGHVVTVGRAGRRRDGLALPGKPVTGEHAMRRWMFTMWPHRARGKHGHHHEHAARSDHRRNCLDALESPAQVMLRWHIQEGRSDIPKSTKPRRIAENFAVCN